MNARGPTRWLFDAWSLFYDLPPVQWATYRPVHDAVLAELRRRPARRVLDLGCGTGQLTARIAGALHPHRITGCDFSLGMLRHAATRSRRVRWVRGDAARLPFHDAAFDTIVSTEAFHWFPDQAAALRECFRVLNPGGRLLMALVNPPLKVVGQVAFAGSRLAGQPFYWPTRSEMRRGVEAAGFQLDHQQRIFRVAGFLLPPVLTCAIRP